MLSGKKQVVETAAPGSVGPAPMVSPMGMPMSPNSPAQGVPAEPLSDDVRMLALDTPAQEFGSSAVMVPQSELLPATPGAALEPHILPAGLEPGFRLAERIPATETLPATEDVRILPVEDDCCSCCGNAHDGKETRPIDRDEPEGRHDHSDDRDDQGRYGHDHADHHKDENDVPPAQDAGHDGTPEGEVTDSVPTEEQPGGSEPCSCCGEKHPGLDADDKPPGGSGTPGEDDEDSEDSKDTEDTEDTEDSEDADGCPVDDSEKPGQEPPSDGPGRPHGENTESELPPTTPGSGGKPTAQNGYDVAEQQPQQPNAPRGTMAPPVSEKLAPLTPTESKLPVRQEPTPNKNTGMPCLCRKRTAIAKSVTAAESTGCATGPGRGA